MRYTEEDILKAKTPMEYIERSLYSKVSQGQKTVISKVWQQRTGYAVEDIKYARNRHPYWKALKMKGGVERNKIRMKKYYFKDTPKTIWTIAEIKKFLKYNNKKGGIYEYKDRELSELLESTIASVQAWRRKVNLINRLFKKLNTRPAKQTEYLPVLMQSSETSLRTEFYKKDSFLMDLIRSQRSRYKS